MTRPETILTTGTEVQANPEQLSVHITSRSEAAEYRGNDDPNQDTLLIDEGIDLYGVFDGLGGHAGGNIASSTAAAAIRDEVYLLPPATTAEEAQLNLVRSLRVADQSLITQMALAPELKGMATAATLAQVIEQPDGKYLVYASVADTRLYIQHHGVTRLITTDEGSGSRVTNCLGAEKGMYQGVAPHNQGFLKLEDGMRVLLTSDGVTGDKPEQLLSEEEINTALNKTDPADAIDELFKISRKDDDTSAIIIDSVTQEPEPTANPEPTTENEDTSRGGKRRRAGRGQGRKKKREAARDARAAERGTGVSDEDAPEPADAANPGEPTPAAGEPGNDGGPGGADGGNPDDATPYSREQQLDMEIGGHREKLAKMHNRKLWGALYGTLKRGEMKKVQAEYEKSVRERINMQLTSEFADGATYEQVAMRKIELMSDEAQEFVAARHETELNKWGRLVRRAGDIVYGTERKLGRRIGMTAAIAAGSLAIATLAPPVAAFALPAIRLAKIGTSGVAGHDSEKGSRRIHEGVVKRKVAKATKKSEVAKTMNGNLEDIDGHAKRGEFSELIEAISKSDTKRKMVSVGGQALAGAGLLKFIADGPSARMPFGGVSAGEKPSFSNLSNTDVSAIKAANPKMSEQDMNALLGKINADPDKFSRFINSVNGIHERTGLSGTALDERVTHTLALAKDKDAYIEAAAGRGITAQAAGEAFDARMAKMVFSDAVRSIHESTGFTGDALLRRVHDTAALAQAKDQFIYQVSDPSEQLARERLFDANFRQFIEELEAKNAA